MAKTQQDTRHITVGGRAYRWRVEQSEAWRGFRIRTIFSIRIEPVSVRDARINAYLVERTTSLSGPALTVGPKLIPELIREAHQQGWKAAPGHRLTLYNLERLAIALPSKRMPRRAEFVRE